VSQQEGQLDPTSPTHPAVVSAAATNPADTWSDVLIIVLSFTMQEVGKFLDPHTDDGCGAFECGNSTQRCLLIQSLSDVPVMRQWRSNVMTDRDFGSLATLDVDHAW
jgi:hypothetical protein